ncbi:dihydrolipoamide acetyltransferase family protein [Planococcus sp. FY231025]|uniref:dihydrolipoamide acetyltransferase family protein n=1 Tax=Planococcus sp. FY231025 TaxID=3455699 RepID=UPI003F91CFB5
MPTYNFTLPDIGEGLHEAEIVRWLVQPGDQVKENENIVEVGTDKAVVEISAPVSGTIQALGGAEGSQVKVGKTLVVFTDVSDERAHGKAAEAIELPAVPVSHRVERKHGERILAAPSVRKAARDAGVNLREVAPTGKGGKILAADLQRHLGVGAGQVPGTAQAAPVSKMPERSAFAENAGARTEPITGTRRAIFNRMTAAKQHAVMCTGMDEVDATALVALRSSLLPHAEGLTYLPFVIKAVTQNLKKYPVFNSSVDEENMEIRYHEAIHIGIATATEQGLLVPVIKNADRKSVLEIAAEIAELTQRARERKLAPSELTGSTFTVSSTGNGGGWYATPILNHPEVAILGVHQIKKQPIVVSDEICIGHLMGMSLTFDHRIIDGEPVGRFMGGVKELLEKPELLVLSAR